MLYFKLTLSEWRHMLILWKQYLKLCTTIQVYMSVDLTSQICHNMCRMWVWNKTPLFKTAGYPWCSMTPRSDSFMTYAPMPHLPEFTQGSHYCFMAGTGKGQLMNIKQKKVHPSLMFFPETLCENVLSPCVINNYRPLKVTLCCKFRTLC